MAVKVERGIMTKPRPAAHETKVMNRVDQTAHQKLQVL